MRIENINPHKFNPHHTHSLNIRKLILKIQFCDDSTLLLYAGEYMYIINIILLPSSILIRFDPSPLSVNMSAESTALTSSIASTSSYSGQQLIIEHFKDSGRHFTAGGIAGIIEVCFAHPFDCMKTRLQIGQFDGILHCVRGTLRNEGPSGFYKGLLPPLIVETPKRAIKFTAFDHYCKALFLMEGKLPEWTRFSLSGLFTGLTEAMLVCPFEVIKVRLQSELNIPLAQQKSAAAVAREILAKHGWGTNGLYLGIGSNLWRHGVWNCCYFGIYHNLRTHFCPKNGPIGGSNGDLPIRLTIASLSAIIANLANIPFDVAKSRIQGPQPEGGRLYFTTWQSIALIQRQHGFLSIYRRLLPFAFIFGPGGGMMLVVYESIYAWLLRHTTPSSPHLLLNQ